MARIEGFIHMDGTRTPSLSHRYHARLDARDDYLSELSRAELVPYVMQLEQLLMFLDDAGYRVGSHIKMDLQEMVREVRDWISEEESADEDE